MAAAIRRHPMSTATITFPAPGESVVHHNVDWETYEVLRDDDEYYNIRMTYDDGNLELMSPSRVHERFSRLTDRFINVWTEERRIPIAGCESTTFKNIKLRQGLEPDKCYYIAHELVVREKDNLDLRVDPPPDLVVEVEVTSKLVPKLPIYANMGVPEIWRMEKSRLQFLALGEDKKYTPIERSLSFPELTPADIQQFLDRRLELDETSLVAEMRAWVRGRA